MPVWSVEFYGDDDAAPRRKGVIKSASYSAAVGIVQRAMGDCKRAKFTQLVVEDESAFADGYQERTLT